MKLPIPREGGILALWFSGLAIGLSFIAERGALLAFAFYLGGSLLLLASIATVEEFIRLFHVRREASARHLVPPVLGLVSWGLVLPGGAVPIFVLFLSVLALVSVRVAERREREWQTRVGFTVAVLLMALLGLVISGSEVSTPLAFFVFAIPFTLFSAQELMVQRIADSQRLSKRKAGILEPQDRARTRPVVLYVFLFAYGLLGAISLPVAPSPIFPVVFELFLVGLSIVWLTSRTRVNFRELGAEQAALDALMVIVIVAFATL